MKLAILKTLNGVKKTKAMLKSMMTKFLIFFLFLNQSFSQNNAGNYYPINSKCNIVLKINLNDDFIFKVDKKKKYEGKIKLSMEGKITYINFENFGGMIDGDTIIIQNSGNSINPYNHFEECEEKFLHFVKKTPVSIDNNQKKIVQDFNLDNIKDTLYYSCDIIENDYEQPYCKVEIITGKFNKKYSFNIYYVGHPTIGSFGRGNIRLFDWTKDTEYTQEYDYSKKHDDWILTKNEELLKYENDKEVNTLPKKYLLGISGKEYVIKKKNLKETRKKKPKPKSN